MGLKCSICDETEITQKKFGYTVPVYKCKQCKENFCEICAISGDMGPACPNCSILVELY